MAPVYCFKFDKLVRDKIPDIIRLSGARVDERKMEKDEYREKLNDKLLEEVQELIAARSGDEIRGELADVLEVILSIGRIEKIDYQEIDRIAAQKREEKGGFDGRIYISSVEVDENNPAQKILAEYYKAHRDKYPPQLG